MKSMQSLKLIIGGLSLLMVGFILLLSMVIRLISPGFAPNLLSYIACSIGLIMGLIGIVQRKRD